MSITPEALAAEVSLPTATTHLTCSVVTATTATPPPTRSVTTRRTAGPSFRDTSLDTYEALELLALGEVVSRKAHDSQLIGIRAALRGGASWEQIAEALAVPPDFAWDSFNEAIAERLDADAAAAPRDLAGARPVR